MCARAEPTSDHSPGYPGSIGTGLLPLGRAWSVPPPQGAEQSPLAPFRTEPQSWPPRQPLETGLGPQRVLSSGKEGSPQFTPGPARLAASFTLWTPGLAPPVTGPQGSRPRRTKACLFCVRGSLAGQPHSPHLPRVPGTSFGGWW